MNRFFNHKQQAVPHFGHARPFLHFSCPFSYITSAANRLLHLSAILLFVIGSGFLLLPDQVYAGIFSFAAPFKSPDTAAPADDPFTNRLAKQILRLHILADNNSAEDQELKLHVRDAILAYVQPLLSDSASAEESEELLSAALPKLTQIADEVLSYYGADYHASAAISTEFFPIRRYGSLLLPPGEYRALRIVLGQGRGHNWWCMLYPSLCFTEGVTGTISVSEKEKLGQLLDDDDYFRLFSEEAKPRVSFRSAELFRKLQKKIRLRIH